jgi:hypothetical protein
MTEVYKLRTEHYQEGGAVEHGLRVWPPVSNLVLQE